MSARCVNLGCAQEVKDGWSFCTFCGTDNRPPAARRSISGCGHQIETGEFCVLCGASVIEENEPENRSAIWFEVIGWALLIGGIAALIVSEMMVRDLTSGPEGFRALNVPGRGRDLSKPANQVYLLARVAFVMIPAGAVFIVFFGRRWRFFKRR